MYMYHIDLSLSKSNYSGKVKLADPSGCGNHIILSPYSYELSCPLNDKDWVHVPVYHREEV